jgi:hypothetical protein
VTVCPFVGAAEVLIKLAEEVMTGGHICGQRNRPRNRLQRCRMLAAPAQDSP